MRPPARLGTPRNATSREIGDVRTKSPEPALHVWISSRLFWEGVQIKRCVPVSQNVLLYFSQCVPREYVNL